MTPYGSQSTGGRLLEFLGGKAELTLIAPFIKTDALRRILDVLDHPAEVVVYTRWRPQEVAIGVSDLDVFEIVEAVGGETRLHPLLHAKAFISGSAALVGSSNATLTGLGWAAIPSLESLYEVPHSDPMLRDLLSILTRASCRATIAIKESIAAQAAQVPTLSTSLEREEPGGESGSISPFGVPRFNVPESAWAAYRGERSEAITKLVMRDLRALGVPAGLEDERTFKAVVGGGLAQGFTGRLIQECADLNAVDAADRFRSLVSEVGEETPAGELGQRYQAFVRWVSYFVPKKTLRASGYTIT